MRDHRQKSIVQQLLYNPLIYFTHKRFTLHMNDHLVVKVMPLIQEPAYVALTLWNAIGEMFGKDLVLGGGTALAARWAHRVSTDVDFFLPPSTLQLLSQDEIQKVTDTLLEIEGVRKDRTWCSPVAINCEISGVPVSVREMMSYRPPTHTLASKNGPPLQDTADILLGKLRHRMATTGRFAIRDLFDINVAYQIEPDTIQHAVAQLTDREFQNIVAGIKRLPDDWHSGDPQKLISPAYNFENDLLSQAINVLIQSNTHENGRSR